MRRPDADVLIAGGGLAAQRCCETLRRCGFDGRIVVLCEEPRAPYDRPPLSKAVLTDGSGRASLRSGRLRGTRRTTSSCCWAWPRGSSTPSRDAVSSCGTAARCATGVW